MTLGSLLDHAELPGIGNPPSKLAGKRVYLLLNSDQGGGAERLADDLVRELQAEDAMTTRCVLYDDPQATVIKKLSAIMRAAMQIMRAAPDVLITFQPTSSVTGGIVARISGCGTRVVHQCNMVSESHPVVAALDRFCGSFGFYTVTIVNSRVAELAFSSYPRRYRRHIRRIDHGIQCAPPSRDRAAVLKAHGIPDEGPLLLSCSRLVSQKRLNIVIAALANIPRASLLLAGQGPEKNTLSKIAAAAGVDRRVYFLGSIPRQQVFELCSVCDLFVSPSGQETFGLAAVEAAMHGVPIVCADLPVLREVLCADGKCATAYVASVDPMQWARVITDVLSSTTMRGEAKTVAPLIREKYSEQRMMRNYRDLFAELLP